MDYTWVMWWRVTASVKFAILMPLVSLPSPSFALPRHQSTHLPTLSPTHPFFHPSIHSALFLSTCSSAPPPPGSMGPLERGSHLNPLGAPISDLLIFFFPERFLSLGPGPGAGSERYREFVMSGFWMSTVTSPRDTGLAAGPVGEMGDWAIDPFTYQPEHKS